MELTQPIGDAELVENIRLGKRMDETIRYLYRANFESLNWWIMNNSGSQQDAEDIFQEVLVSFIDLVQRNKFRGESTVKTFLFSLNRFAWLNELKRRGRAVAREEKYEKEQDRVGVDITEDIAGRETTDMIMKLMDRIGETCKKILLLFYYENRSISEILADLHYENEQVVRNKKYKCLKQLEQMLNEKPSLKQTLKNLLHG